MRRLLNTLYVTTDGAYVRKDGLNVVVDVEGEERLRAPMHLLGSVIAFGRVALSPPLMGALAEAGIGMAFLSAHGRFWARVEGPVSGNVLLRRDQYRRSDDAPSCAAVISAIVAAKAANQRVVVQRAVRDHGGTHTDTAANALDECQLRLRDIARRAAAETDIDRLRGHEGEAAAVYFSVFPQLIRSPDPKIAFRGRSRRPPLDAPNALLSFLYTLLAHDCRSALEGVGLDPAVGFLHRLRPGRPSLALDLMEELRPQLADRLALSLFNRSQMTSADFRWLDNGAVLLSDDARRAVLTAYQERKKEEVEHPYLGERVPLGLIAHVQATLLARCLRGELDGYPPMLWR